jgi:hypothetical protein
MKRKKGNKKAEVFFLCFSGMPGVFLLSLKDPPAYRRAKPIIKAMLSGNLFAEHCFSVASVFSSAIVEVILFSASPTSVKIIRALSITCQGSSAE